MTRPGLSVVPPQTAGTEPPNGRVQDHAERLVRIETILENMATKTDIESIKTLLSTRESQQMKWLVGIVLLGLFSIIAAVIKTFLG